MAVLAAFGLTAWIGVVALAQGSSAPTPSTSTSTTTSPAPTGIDDVKGNCDEAEHANDPGCLGVIPLTEDDHDERRPGRRNDDDQGDVNDDDQGDVNDDDQGDERRERRRPGRGRRQRRSRQTTRTTTPAPAA